MRVAGSAISQAPNLPISQSHYPLPPRPGDAVCAPLWQHQSWRQQMAGESILTTISNGLADAVAGAAPSVVQVQGRRRAVSGVTYSDGVVVTSARALGREDGIHVRRHDGAVLDAELAGWDPATGLAVLRSPELGVTPL